MNIFILEDDGSCKALIDWIKNLGDEVMHVKNIEDMAYYLEYEEGYKDYDKYIIDASLPAASVLHPDETEEEYNGTLNGIDYMLENFPKLGIELHDERVAVLTAFAGSIEGHLKSKQTACCFSIIDKNDNKLKNRLQEFLQS